MGVDLTWLAVEGADKASVLARLGLVEAGAAGDELSSALACAVFPDGWLVLVSTGSELNLKKALPQASAEGLALGCEIEEHVMFSRLRAFQGGALTWAVTHDPDVDVRGVAVQGEPPSPFADIRAALAALQVGEHDDVDHMFEAPILLGQALCGYRHDERRPAEWTILEHAGRRRGGPRAARPPQRIQSELTRRLLDAFATDLEPTLRARGWTLHNKEAEFRGGVWWFHRVTDGRHQTLGLWWTDHGPALNIEANFAVADGPDAMDSTVLRGRTRAVREAGQIESLHLRRRIAALFRSRAAEARRETAPPAPMDPFEKLIARVKADLAAIEAVLAGGEPSPRLEVWRPSPSA